MLEHVAQRGGGCPILKFRLERALRILMQLKMSIFTSGGLDQMTFNQTQMFLFLTQQSEFTSFCSSTCFPWNLFTVTDQCSCHLFHVCMYTSNVENSLHGCKTDNGYGNVCLLSRMSDCHFSFFTKLVSCQRNQRHNRRSG